MVDHWQKVLDKSVFNLPVCLNYFVYEKMYEHEQGMKTRIKNLNNMLKL